MSAITYIRPRAIAAIDDLVEAARASIDRGYVCADNLIAADGGMQGEGELNDSCIYGEIHIEEGSKVIQCYIDPRVRLFVGKNVLIKNLAIQGSPNSGTVDIHIGDNSVIIGAVFGMYFGEGPSSSTEKEGAGQTSFLKIGDGSLILGSDIRITRGRNVYMTVGTARILESRLQFDHIFGRDYKATKDSLPTTQIDDGLFMFNADLTCANKGGRIKIGKNLSVVSSKVSGKDKIDFNLLNAELRRSYTGIYLESRNCRIGDNVVFNIGDGKSGMTIIARDMLIGNGVNIARLDNTMVLAIGELRLGEGSTVFGTHCVSTRSLYRGLHSQRLENLKARHCTVSVGNGAQLILETYIDRKNTFYNVSVPAGTKYII